MPHVLISGATGFVGQAVTARFLRAGWTVTALTRDAVRARERLPAAVAAVAWNPRDPRAFAGALPAVDAVVHLAGASVAGGLWTAKRKRILRDSRIAATRALVDALGRSEHPPPAFVCVSGMGYHGDAGERTVHPGDARGAGFLGDLAADWEKEARRAEGFGARAVSVRLGMVLGRGGPLAPLALASRVGLGAVLGNGRQYHPWIHLEDAAGLFFEAATRADVRGPVHGVGEPVTQEAFARALARAVRRPLFLRVPAAVLRFALGDMADLFLHGQRAGPDPRFTLRYPRLADALRAALH